MVRYTPGMLNIASRNKKQCNLAACSNGRAPNLFSIKRSVLIVSWSSWEKNHVSSHNKSASSSRCIETQEIRACTALLPSASICKGDSPKRSSTWVTSLDLNINAAWSDLVMANGGMLALRKCWMGNCWAVKWGMVWFTTASLPASSFWRRICSTVSASFINKARFHGLSSLSMDVLTACWI